MSENPHFYSYMSLIFKSPLAWTGIYSYGFPNVNFRLHGFSMTQRDHERFQIVVKKESYSVTTSSHSTELPSIWFYLIFHALKYMQSINEFPVFLCFFFILASLLKSKYLTIELQWLFALKNKKGMLWKTPVQRTCIYALSECKRWLQRKTKFVYNHSTGDKLEHQLYAWIF